MARQIGSQYRETLEESGMVFVEKRVFNEDPEEFEAEVILMDVESGKREIWFANDHHSGYTIEVEGIGYEYVCGCL